MLINKGFNVLLHICIFQAPATSSILPISKSNVMVNSKWHDYQLLDLSNSCQRNVHNFCPEISINYAKYNYLRKCNNPLQRIDDICLPRNVNISLHRRHNNSSGN